MPFYDAFDTFDTLMLPAQLCLVHIPRTISRPDKVLRFYGDLNKCCLLMSWILFILSNINCLVHIQARQASYWGFPLHTELPQPLGFKLVYKVFESCHHLFQEKFTSRHGLSPFIEAITFKLGLNITITLFGP